ncbi:hypothetical protein A6D6_01807 [Alcanivorax xiamenensis]|uniref:Uncharacterized protein n=1 Tax=Alcanivorax xiamenensis TaxID=1177156 RepID=A0ABQ6Y956_9GAMM|nr:MULTISPECIES: hypothetical protein [Alcanivorax]KAF0806227.1 hypothetical protein A6D6_01807 [Alcanivorax xiamenensis]
MGVFGCMVLSLLAVALLYLRSPNQRWLARPLTGVVWRVLSWALLLLSWPAWMMVLDAKAGFFAALTLLMLLLGTLPLLSLLKEGRA